MRNQAKYHECSEDEYARLLVCKNNNMSKILSGSLDLVNAIRLLPVSKDMQMRRPFGISGYVPANPLCRMDCGTMQKLALSLRDANIDDFNVGD